MRPSPGPTLCFMILLRRTSKAGSNRRLDSVAMFDDSYPLTPQFCVCLEVGQQLSPRQHTFQVAVGNDGKLVYVVTAH